MSAPTARARARSRSYQRGPHLYRRDGGIWYARGGSLPHGGTSLRTSDRAEAERRLLALVAGRLDAHDVGRAPQEAALLACVTAWLAAPHGYTARTLQSARLRLAAAGEHLAAHGVTLPSEITPPVVDEWIATRSRTVSRRTVNRDLRALRVCLRWCAERGLCAPVPALRRELREPSRSSPRELPTQVELEAVVAALAERHTVAALAVRALAATGCRIEELRRLVHEDLHRSEVWVRPEAGAADTAATTKGYATRRVPICADAAADVREFLDGRGAYAVSEAWLLRHLHAAQHAAGHPRWGLHDLRRLFVTRAYRTGVPIQVIAAWVGHRSTRTTEGYLGSIRGDGSFVAPPALSPAAAAESLLNPGAESATPARSSGSVQRPGRGSKTA